MFGGHFYHAILRKSVAVFGSLFDNINVIRKKSNGEGVITKVPLAYGPKDKFLARINEQPNLNDTKIGIKLPRISFEITSLAYDTEVKTSRFSRVKVSETPDTRDTINHVPYRIGMQLNIMAKNQDEGLQILEQILPTFQPEYTVSVKFVDDLNKSFDVPIVLENVSIQDEYEGDFQSRRVLMYTLDFTMRIKFFSGLSTSNIIKRVETHFHSIDGAADYSNIIHIVNPFGANEDEEHVVQSIRDFYPLEGTFTFTGSTSTDLYRDGEVVYGQDSGTFGIIGTKTFDANAQTLTLILDEVDGQFIQGEQLIGLITKDSITIP